MCNVSFCLINDEVVFTSNRDEKVQRPPADLPVFVSLKHKKICYPKDPSGGGTWVACDNSGNCIILLNGAFQMHQLKSKYRKSRGLIVLESISSVNPWVYLEEVSLVDIEPFQIICYSDKKLNRLVWDGEKKYLYSLVVSELHFFSSATLYNEDERSERNKWFFDFVDQGNLTADSVFDFHRGSNSVITGSSLIINKKNLARTYSITQFSSSNTCIQFKHFDVLTGKEKTLFL